MSEPYRNLTFCEELTISYVCEESEFSDPLAILTDWVTKLELFYEVLSPDEISAVFTICECVLDIKHKRVHSIRDKLYDTPFLRTYILLYTTVKGGIYIVGSCKSHTYLLSKASMEDLPFSDLEEIRNFLNELSREKTLVTNEFTHLFPTQKTKVFEITPIESYKKALEERFHYLLAGVQGIEFLSPQRVSTFEHAIYMYLCFAASASSRLVDNLVQTELAIFRKAYSELKGIPWLRHEFVRRYLGVDWEGIQTNFYRDIFVSSMDNSLLFYDSALYATEHSYIENAFADFFVKVPALYSPMVSQFHCKEHENACPSKLSIDKGMHIVPYGMLEDCAAKALEKQIRLMCNKLSRIYCTHEAFTTWFEKPKNKGAFTFLRISEEPAEVQERYINSVLVESCAEKWYQRLKVAKSNPSLVCGYDREIIETSILPFWESVIFKRYSERLDRIQETRELKKFHNDGKEVFNQAIPTTYDELVKFAADYWSPCMNRLVAICKGSHLDWDKRVLVVRFLISPVLRYSAEQARTLWELFWKESDVYVGETKFWTNSSEYAVAFNSFMDKGDEDREKWKYWPPCAKLISHNLCPFSGDSEVVDIEEAASPLVQKQRKCAFHMKEVLNSRGRQPRFRDPKIYSPMSYTACTNASYQA